MSDKYQGVECYQCGRLKTELSYRSRCLKCETERADGNAAENDMLRKRLANTETALKRVSDYNGRLEHRLAAAKEARDNLLTEAERLWDDLLMQAEIDSNGTKVVAAGFTRWCKFKEAIKKSVMRGMVK